MVKQTTLCSVLCKDYKSIPDSIFENINANTIALVWLMTYSECSTILWNLCGTKQYCKMSERIDS